MVTVIRGFHISAVLLSLLGITKGMDSPVAVELHELPKGFSRHKLSAYCDDWKSQPLIFSADLTTTKIQKIGQYLKTLTPNEYEQFQETAHSVVRHMDKQQAIQFLSIFVTIPLEQQSEFAFTVNTLGIRTYKHPNVTAELKRLLLKAEQPPIEDLEFLSASVILAEKTNKPIIFFLLPEVKIHSPNGRYILNPEMVHTWAYTNQALLKKEQLSEEDQFKKIAFDALRQSLLDRLSPDSKFLQVVTRISYAQNPHAEQHSQYAKALLSKGFCLRPPKIDNLETENISPHLLNLTLQDGLRLYYVLGDFSNLLFSVQQKMKAMTTVQPKLEEVSLALLKMKIMTKYEE